MNIKYFETVNNTKHNIFGKNTHTLKGFKSLEFKTLSYPDIKITNFDF